MNILYDHQVFALQRYGGVSRIFYELIKHLVEKKEVNILLFHGWHINRYPLEELKDKMVFYWGKKTIFFPHVSFLLKGFNPTLFKRYTSGKAIDIYHPTNYSPNLHRWKKSPVVLTVNDMIPELFPQNFRDIKSRLRIKKKCIERADMIIAISHQTGKDLLNYYDVARDKVRVIYPGAPPLPGQGEEIRPFPHPRSFILYVGTRKQGYKNFYGFYSGFTASPKLIKQFDIICFGGGYFKKKELHFLSGTGHPVRIFQPPGDEKVLAGLYCGAAALVYPSLYEGFGLPPLEAMAYGCPVIAAKTSALPEVLGEAATYFDPYDPESITSAMESVLFNPALKKEMAKKGKNQAKKYSWEKMAEETYRLYRELAG